MKARNIKKLLYCLISMFVFIGCTKDQVVPIDIEDKTFSFNEDVVPLIEDNCNAASCHGGGVRPNLSNDPYRALLVGNYINPDNPENASDSKLYKKLNGTHNDGRITNLVKRSFELWMEQGAENN